MTWMQAEKDGNPMNMMFSRTKTVSDQSLAQFYDIL